MLGADGLIYQEVDDLIAVGKSMNDTIEQFDASCFDGKYVTGESKSAGVGSTSRCGRQMGRHQILGTGLSG